MIEVRRPRFSRMSLKSTLRHVRFRCNKHCHIALDLSQHDIITGIAREGNQLCRESIGRLATQEVLRVRFRQTTIP
jgi:hypothetical protein